MTDRMTLLERVAEAAREYYRIRSIPSGEVKTDEYLRSRVALERSIFALDAHPAEAVGETVTLGLIRGRHTGVLSGSSMPEQEDPRDWEHIGTLVFRMPAPITIPTVAARVET